MKLSILIPTVIERAEQFHRLRVFIQRQIIDFELEDQVEIIYLQDNKEISIGKKRDELYKMANGAYSWMIDDDDWVHYNALPIIIDTLKINTGIEADCVCFKELCIFDGKRVESSNFSLQYGGWADNVDGFNHVRTPFFKTPIKTNLCKHVGVADMRFGEDHDFAIRIKPYLKHEAYIHEFIYIYRHNSSSHNERYGITNL
jgi:hypothetical protein